MAEVTYSWPAADKTSVIGKDAKRLDGIPKSTGAAKYSYDINPKNQLIVKALDCPHAHCLVKAIDTSAAENVPGVVHVKILPPAEIKKDDAGMDVFPEIKFQGELLVAVAAETEAAAAEGVSKLQVEYEELDVFVNDEDLAAAEAASRTRNGGSGVELQQEPGDDVDDEEAWEEQEIERLLNASAQRVDGYYGIDVITHCCLEPHGSTVEWQNGKLTAHLSTQNVSGTPDQFAGPLGITANDVEVHCDYIGGGFGSKFAADYWGVAAAEISKATGRAVKFMLDRDQELKIAGSRPSGYIKVRLGANADGIVQVWDSHHWGTGGPGPQGGAVGLGNIPYVFQPPNYRRKATVIDVNAGPQRAWRAPSHPQACAITQTAYDDLAAKMGADSLEIFQKNLAHLSSPERAGLYAEEMRIGADLMDWKAKWHPHGKGQANGSIVEGLGLAIHTWGGGPNSSSCTVKIHPDGSVETLSGTQDLGTGTRTICAMVVAETLGLPIEAISVNIGSSKYPAAGASGGSTTVGGISGCHRRAALEAAAKIYDLVGPKLDADPNSLEAVAGRIQVKGQADKSLSWKEATNLLGMRPLEVTASHTRNDQGSLTNSGVGGVQMAHVAVDKETGVVKIKKVVAVQDMGLIINPHLAKSQINGALCMAIAYALFEQRIMDPATGAFLNAELGEYKLPRLGDVGEIVVHLHEPPEERQRGVIGLGEPPVISGGAAISNAVCNALGVRVPVLPLTPKRVLDAIRTAGRV
jgi:xanthine dehydrogenase YagR molybdenum-binding subunit